MNVNVVSGSNPHYLLSSFFPEPSSETKNWLYEQFNRDNSMLTGIGKTMIDTANHWYRQLNDPSIYREARKIVRNIRGVFDENGIVEMDSLSSLQKAKPLMQRYLMANPAVRRLYQRQLIDGYSDSYQSRWTHELAFDDYDFRRVFSGVLRDEGEGEDYRWKITVCVDDLIPGDRELEADEKNIIIDAMALQIDALRKGKDPTDIFNGDLPIVLTEEDLRFI